MQKKATKWPSSGRDLIVVGVLLVYLATPVFVTLLYALSAKWQATVLPDRLTLEHFIRLFTTQRYHMALARTLAVSLATIAISLLTLIPVIYMTKVHYRRFEKVLGVLSMIPFSLSGIILAVGLIRLYSGGFLPISGTVHILIGAYYIVILPFMYQGIKNSLDTLEIKSLLETAKILGASEVQTFFRVILPNIMKGVVISVLLSLSILMGEFVLANMLVGGQYETVQVYMYWSRGGSGHYSSAIIMSYFSLIVLISAGILYLNPHKGDA